jgi:hypothetical protein
MTERRSRIRTAGPLIARAIAHGPALVAGTLAVATTAAAIHWGSFVAGGSDSNCYLTTARMIRSGTLLAPVRYGFASSWSNAALSLAPTGFAPSAVTPGALAPICPPGLGLVMAGASLLAGNRAAYAVIPICGALVVWCAFVLGSRLSVPWIGVAAAALTLATPIVLFQVFQPMSDVPATACLVISLACLTKGAARWTGAAGVAAGLAILIRPNLAPACLPLAALAWTATSDSSVSARLQSLVWFAAGCVPGIMTTLIVNALVYGSPFRSGYGDATRLFAVAHILPNLVRYPAWLIELGSPWILTGLLAPVLLGIDPPRQSSSPSRSAVAWTIVAILAALLVIYLPYSVFDDWTYLRFFLPASVMLTAAAAAAICAGLRRLPLPLHIATAIVVFCLVVVWSIRSAKEHGVFTVWQSEQRFVDVARWIDRNTPANSVVVTIWHSGSIRYYAGRPSILWDAIEPAEFNTIVQTLEAQHRPVYLLLESWERSAFAQRFRGTTASSELDWPPRAQFGRDIALYDVGAREQFHRGEPTPTERVFTTAERAAFRR